MEEFLITDKGSFSSLGRRLQLPTTKTYISFSINLSERHLTNLARCVNMLKKNWVQRGYGATFFWLRHRFPECHQPHAPSQLYSLMSLVTEVFPDLMSALKTDSVIDGRPEVVAAGDGTGLNTPGPEIPHHAMGPEPQKAPSREGPRQERSTRY